MELQESQNHTENGFALFVPFAQGLLACLKAWIAAEGVRPQLYQYVHFGEHTWRPRYEVKPDYFLLFAQHMDDSCWQREEIDRYVGMLWTERILQTSKGSQTNGDVKSSAPEQIRSTLFNDLVDPILDVLEHDETFEPAQEQLLESYTRFRERWTAQNVGWEVNIPLLHFTSTLQHKQPVSPSFFLTPFSPVEKTAVWNRGINPDYPALHYVDFSAFQQTHFQLVGAYTQPRNVHGSFEIAAEAEDLITSNECGNLALLTP